jgi:hypothetical protein
MYLGSELSKIEGCQQGRGWKVRDRSVLQVFIISSEFTIAARSERLKVIKRNGVVHTGSMSGDVYLEWWKVKSGRSEVEGRRRAVAKVRNKCTTAADGPSTHHSYLVCDNMTDNLAMLLLLPYL